MEPSNANQPTSFYCNRCDKWVDGIEDPENQPKSGGMKKVMCEECGSAILYRPASLWKRLRRRAAEIFSRAQS